MVDTDITEDEERNIELFFNELDNYINSAIESFCNLNTKDIDLVKVKLILKEEYNLVLIEEPFSLKEI